ncbi:hypothetical protein Ddc_16651 [Ditylenchus destructor]|nr:hypothetical protein Ddc_16651 [Ditylenchus destructor]
MCNTNKKFKISLSSEALAEILRQFSRKQLCEKIHRVNRQFFLLSLTSFVPITHVIDEVRFENPQVPSEGRTEQQNSESSGALYHSTHEYCVRIVKRVETSTIDRLFATQRFTEMEPPAYFIRFRKVTIQSFIEESIIQFLCKAKNSFDGCNLFLDLTAIVQSYHHNPDIEKNVADQVCCLLQNVFHKPSSLSLYSKCSADSLRILFQLLQTNALSNCNDVTLHLREQYSAAEQTNNDLIEWLKNCRNQSCDLKLRAKKHVILERYPRRLILNMIQQLRQAFEADSLLLSTDFVITFLGCETDTYRCLEGDHEFVMNSSSIDGRLSFFKHFVSRNPDQVYRLWYRRVTNEEEDSVTLSYLQNSQAESNGEVGMNIGFSLNNIVLLSTVIIDDENIVENVFRQLFMQQHNN